MAMNYFFGVAAIRKIVTLLSSSEMVVQLLQKIEK